MKITHELLDRRCLALHQCVAEKIRRQPDLIEVARNNLRQWAGPDGELPPALQEWQTALMTLSVAEIVALLRDPGDEAARMRQSSPFAGILSEAERLAILREYEPRAA